MKSKNLSNKILRSVQSKGFKYNKITIKNLFGTKGENNQITFPKENLIDEIKKFI